MASRNRAPSPERGCARASRPTAPSRSSSRQGKTGGRAAATATAAAASASSAVSALALMDDTTPVLRVGVPNPQVQAIRSRVNELVRRYDESLAEDAARSVDGGDSAAADGEDSDDSDEDGGASGRRRLPAQWKVGDVLLAAHSALARTGARTERAMVAEFAREDPEVAEAMGSGEKAFEQALAAAAQRAQQTHEVLARSLAMMQQLQEEAVAAAIADGDKSASASDDRALQRRTRELRAAVEALSKDKQALLAQLQEQLKAHREALAVADQQAQALKRAQLALNLKTEELRAQREEGERRVGEGAQALEAAQQLASGWKEKQQLATKAGAAAESRAQELEGKCRALDEELARANGLLASKAQEADALRDAARESEAARLRAVSDARAAAEASMLAKAQAEGAASSRSNASKRAQAAAVEEATRALSRENQELAERIERAEAEVCAMAAKLSEATHRRQQFENDNHELARVVREMQERARLQQQQQSKPLPLPKRSSSFSISLRMVKSPSADGQRRKTRRRGSRPTAEADEDEDDLSTTSESEGEEEQPQSKRSDRPKKRLSPEAEEAARDEAELNDTMHQVVESAFPHVEHPADALEDDIAQFEDAQRSPMRRLTAVEPPSNASDEVARVRAECAQELARMKTQYVAGLLEYKALVIEQYERRQGEESARHRLEIERLILLVQTKFRREMERRGQRVAQAQASLKLLYRAMVGRKGRGNGLSGVHEDQGEDADDHDEDVRVDEEDESSAERAPVPLKAMLRAAILAMSSSTKRNAQATAQLTSIYEAVKARRALSSSAGRVQKPDLPTVVGSSKSSTPPPATPSPLPITVAHVACQVSAGDFTPVTFARGLRGSTVAPEDMAGVVLPSAACFPRPEPMTSPYPASPPRRWPWASKAELDLVDGAALAERLEADVRRCLPRLPPGPHVVSPALRRLLLRQLVRFFADLQPPQQHEEEEEEEVVAAVGSPRDTPFMRRKALEGLERSRTQRRQRLAHHILQGT